MRARNILHATISSTTHQLTKAESFCTWRRGAFMVSARGKGGHRERCVWRNCAWRASAHREEVPGERCDLGFCVQKIPEHREEECSG